MKQIRNLFRMLALLILLVSPAMADNVVELKKCTCTSGAEARNKQVLENAIRSNTTVQLPEGEFSSEPISVNGVSNLTIKGTAEGSTLKTKVKIMSSTGVSLSNVSGVMLQDLELEGSANSSLVVLSQGGGYSATNMKLETAENATAYTDCLQPDLAWLVPVISNILF